MYHTVSLPTALAVFATLSGAAPSIEGRPNPAVLKILTRDPARVHGACASDKVADIQAALSEAKTLATAAAAVLAKPGVEQSEGVRTWLGTMSAATFKQETLHRVTNLALSLGGTVAGIGVLPQDGADNEILLLCSLDNDNGCSQHNALAYAVDKTGTHKYNSIVICKPSFTGLPAAVLERNRQQYEARKSATNFSQFDSLGSTFLRLGQEFSPLRGLTSSNAELKPLFRGLASPLQCAGLPDDERAKNPQNWALTVFVANVDPERFDPSVKPAPATPQPLTAAPPKTPQLRIAPPLVLAAANRSDSPPPHKKQRLNN